MTGIDTTTLEKAIAENGPVRFSDLPADMQHMADAWALADAMTICEYINRFWSA